jgi:cobyrinic acid a,c-diamide synthase
VKGFLVAGTASGVGKTTVALALIAAMRRLGLVVQPFKGGPDFLDTGHHTRIAGRSARNIDTWMLSAQSNQDIVRQASQGADVIIAEGMMGLFDGKDGTTEAGSSAEIAKLLKLPVLLVLDAGKSARSIAAVVLGFESFDPTLTLAGVILNRVASERHFTMLQTAIVASCKTPVLGWLPKEPSIAIPERHLGLRTAEERNGERRIEEERDLLALFAEKHLDMEKLLSLECELNFSEPALPHHDAPRPHVRIGVARDQAFTFYYEDNLDLLREHGAEIIPFSPLLDTELPKDLDALYLGGGYPELHAEALSANQSMLSSIQDFAASARPIYAECGGMIYLAQQLTLTDSHIHALAGVLPFAMEMTDSLVRFGYVAVELTHDCLLGSRGTSLRGHSFHYSRIANQPAIETAYRLRYSLSKQESAEGYTIGNILASYIHVHFRTAPHVAQSFVDFVRLAKTRELATA